MRVTFQYSYLRAYLQTFKNGMQTTSLQMLVFLRVSGGFILLLSQTQHPSASDWVRTKIFASKDWSLEEEVTGELTNRLNTSALCAFKR